MLLESNADGGSRPVLSALDHEGPGRSSQCLPTLPQFERLISETDVPVAGQLGDFKELMRVDPPLKSLPWDVEQHSDLERTDHRPTPFDIEVVGPRWRALNVPRQQSDLLNGLHNALGCGLFPAVATHDLLRLRSSLLAWKLYPAA